jgi:hypothetical protein
MEQTAVEKMIQYFIEQKNNGVSHWCINDLIGQLYQAKEMEKEQIGKAFLNGRLKEIGSGVLFDLQPLTETFHNYYNETFNKQ